MSAEPEDAHAGPPSAPIASTRASCPLVLRVKRRRDAGQGGEDGAPPPPETIVLSKRRRVSVAEQMASMNVTGGVTAQEPRVRRRRLVRIQTAQTLADTRPIVESAIAQPEVWRTQADQTNNRTKAASTSRATYRQLAPRRHVTTGVSQTTVDVFDVVEEEASKTQQAEPEVSDELLAMVRDYCGKENDITITPSASAAGAAAEEFVYDVYMEMDDADADASGENDTDAGGTIVSVDDDDDDVRYGWDDENDADDWYHGGEDEDPDGQEVDYPEESWSSEEEEEVEDAFR